MVRGVGPRRSEPLQVRATYNDECFPEVNLHLACVVSSEIEGRESRGGPQSGSGPRPPIVEHRRGAEAMITVPPGLSTGS